MTSEGALSFPPLPKAVLTQLWLRGCAKAATVARPDFGMRGLRLDRTGAWEELRVAANAGDARAFARFLVAVTPTIRAVVRARGQGMDADIHEDIVQDVLIAIHLKRHTWQPDRPVRPWLYAVTRHKVVDAFRRRGASVHLPVEDFADVIADDRNPDPAAHLDAAAVLSRIDARSAMIVRAIEIEGATPADVDVGRRRARGAAPGDAKTVRSRAGDRQVRQTRSTTTEDLIATLAMAPAPRPWRPGLVAAGMLLTAGLGVAAYLWSMGVRPGLGASLVDVVTLAKVALPVMLAGLALPFALRLARPEGRPGLWPLAIPLVLALALMAITAVATPVAALGAVVMGGTSVKCVTSILVLSAVPLALSLALMRRGAPTRPALAGATIGLAVGAAAAGYALSCAEDSPLFFVTWYGAAILAVGAIGGLAGKLALRW